jgi:hypothetical protein
LRGDAAKWRATLERRRVWFVLGFGIAVGLVARSQIHSSEGELTPLQPLGWMGIAALVVGTGVIVWATKYYEYWMFWSDRSTALKSRRDVWAEVLGTLVAVFLMLERFSAIAGAFALQGWTTVTGFRYVDPTCDRSGFSCSGPGLWGYDVYVSAELYYLWHLLDAVPVLQIPRR